MWAWISNEPHARYDASGAISTEKMRKHIKNHTELRELHLAYAESTMQLLQYFNTLPHITQLQFASICENRNENFATINNFIATNTTICSLYVAHCFEQFMHAMSQNSTITFLYIDDNNRIDTPPRQQSVDLGNYISTNTTLKSLGISLSAIVENEIVFDALSKNTVLHTLKLRNRYSVRASNESRIANLLRNTKTLRALHLPNEYTSSILTDSIVKNSSLTFLALSFSSVANFTKFIDDILPNLNILNMDHTVRRLVTQDIPVEKVNYMLARNDTILWKNVHSMLFSFTLIFHFLPPYVLLEIFDWLPYMHLVRHGLKIQLIVSTLRSIHTLRNFY